MKAKARTNRELSALEKRAIERISGKAVSLASLVDDLSKEMGCSTDKATEGLMALESRKLIVVSEGGPRASLPSYAASPASLWFWGAVVATLLSAVFLLATSGLALYLRYAFGSVFILFLPGYALIEALYPKKELDELTRFALSIGLSLAIVPLAGLILNYTPFGLRLLPVAVFLAGTTIALLTVALTRRYQYYRLAKGLT